MNLFKALITYTNRHLSMESRGRGRASKEAKERASLDGKNIKQSRNILLKITPQDILHKAGGKRKTGGKVRRCLRLTGWKALER